MRSVWRTYAAAVAVLLASTALPGSAHAATSGSGVAPAVCGAGSHPEHGLQGQVPLADRQSGRSKQGYTCNLTLVGQYQGSGATWVNPSYGHCSYIGTFAPGDLQMPHPGVQVVDVSNPAHPVYSTALSSPAMLAGTWETLKVDPVHGYLAAMGVPGVPGVGGLLLDIYDIKTDCAHPRLLNGLLGGALTIPELAFAHEAGFSPDGRTYYVTSAGGSVAAIDVSNPRSPKLLYEGPTAVTNHGFSFSPDGRTMYGVTAVPAGVQVLDVSDIQTRKAAPQVRQIGALTWNDGFFSQMTIPFTENGHPYLYAVDEAGNGGVRLLDIATPAHPTLVREYRLGIDQPSALAAREADTGGDGAFGYDAHYCSIDRPTNPTKLACGFFQSGVRLWDVTKPMAPRELGYYNPPAQVGRQEGGSAPLVNSAHAWAVYAPNVLDPNSFGLNTLISSLQPSMTTDWCSSAPQFRPNNTLWVTCQDNGFMVLRYRAATVAPKPTASTASPQAVASAAGFPDAGVPDVGADGGTRVQALSVYGIDAGLAGSSGPDRTLAALWSGLALVAAGCLGLFAWTRRRAGG